MGAVVGSVVVGASVGSAVVGGAVVASVTVVADSALVCDALSTALFVMGLERAADFWRAHPELGLDLLFITTDGAL